MLTQNDIADAAGLSRMTVHRYLSGQKVSKKTREKLNKFLAESEYRPNLTARSLVSKKTHLIGLIVPSVAVSFYPDLIQKIQGYIRQNKYILILCVSNEDPVQELEEINLLLSIPVDGVIISPTSYGDSEKNCMALKREPIPFIMVDRQIPSVPGSFVGTDGYSGSKALVKHLISLGHRKIAHFGGPPLNNFAKRILDGYMDALKEFRIPIDDSVIFSGSMDEDNGQENLPKILSLPQAKRPTAIQAVNDPVAFGILKSAPRYGIRIPDDVALIGFSDLHFSNIISVPLTTVREDTDKMAKEAVRILIELIEKKRKRNVSILLNGEIIIRESSGQKKA